ncbi:DUF4870 domain-containing protein [Sphingobacterium wenxiniae]|uniref:Chloroplast import component protein (Tic20) n=1 Tax=Sphingobacterium wenxiniae TaxID=683125 RepID=A0A1I6QD46_9SPHI|nr:hypothetical protein [Sphingobacterium wenxiniae]SFS50423.1 hypothetical protein SAMN05660206_102281 [Sphingobacterium wenxiniae]
MKTSENLTPTNNIEEGKTIAIISYLTIIGLIAAFVMNKDKNNAFAQFHIRQSVGLTILSFVSGLLNFIPFIGWIIGIVTFVIFIAFLVMGIMSALNGSTKPVPLVGEKIQETFKSL